MSHYWFKPKRYGYGATPVTWEGWALTVAVVVVVAGSLVGVNRLVDRSDGVAWLVWAALMAAMVLWLVRFSWRRTDGEWRWRWRADKKQ
jgi:O-antigen/teichoic acid export membrane protein